MQQKSDNGASGEVTGYLFEFLRVLLTPTLDMGIKGESLDDKHRDD